MIRRRTSTKLSLLSSLTACAALCAVAALAGAQPEPDDQAEAERKARAKPGGGVERNTKAKAKNVVAPTGPAEGDEDGESGPQPEAGGSPQAGAGAGAPASPHERSLIGERDCSECHTPDGWSLSGGDAEGGFDHAQTGFPLTGTHEFVSCIGCHGSERRISRDCAGCHHDAHQGRLGVQCDQCHSSRTWHDTRAIERHRRTRLPLTGVHALLDCSSCHLRTASSTWSHVPADCFACHEKDYRADIHPVHQGDPEDPALAQFPRDCRRCHRPTGWTPAVIDPNNLFATAAAQKALRDHDRRFPLSFGKHRGARCESCHVAAPKAMHLVACTGCHVHSPATLRRRHGGRVVAMDAAGCLRCHPGGAAR